MFDFQKLRVYQKSKGFYNQLLIYIFQNDLVDSNNKSQLRRAAISITHNIAEGAGKYTKPDKKRFYLMAKASTNECLAALELIELENILSLKISKQLENELDEISRMLTCLIRSQS